MITRKEFERALKIVNKYSSQIELHYKEVNDKVNNVSKLANITKDSKLGDVDLSVRLINILRANEDKFNIDASWNMKLEELSNVSMSKFLECRVAGKKTLHELKEVCYYAGVDLLP